MKHLPLLLALPFALLAAPAPAFANGARELSDSALRGQTLAQAHCAACHGVTPNASSPNPEAPTWDDVANRPGTTRATLRRFLRDSHNYPEAMQFKIEPRHIRDLADYLVTLKRVKYRPGI